MKVKIEIEEGLEEEEVVIRCGSLNDSVVSLQNYISKQSNGKRCLTLTSGETDFFVPIDEIYFFETEGRELRATRQTGYLHAAINFMSWRNCCREAS